MDENPKVEVLLRLLTPNRKSWLSGLRSLCLLKLW